MCCALVWALPGDERVGEAQGGFLAQLPTCRSGVEADARMFLMQKAAASLASNGLYVCTMARMWLAALGSPISFVINQEALA